MSITQLLLWCLENDVEFSIKTNQEIKTVMLSIKKIKGKIYHQDIESTREFLLSTNLDDAGEYLLKEAFERLTNAIEHPITFDHIFKSQSTIIDK